MCDCVAKFDVGDLRLTELCPLIKQRLGLEDGAQSVQEYVKTIPEVCMKEDVLGQEVENRGGGAILERCDVPSAQGVRDCVRDGAVCGTRRIVANYGVAWHVGGDGALTMRRVAKFGLGCAKGRRA